MATEVIKVGFVADVKVDLNRLSKKIGEPVSISGFFAMLQAAFEAGDFKGLSIYDVMDRNDIEVPCKVNMVLKQGEQKLTISDLEM